jgi:hypothetical protein
MHIKICIFVPLSYIYTCMYIFKGSDTDTGATVSYTKKGDKMNSEQISGICKKFLQSSGDYLYIHVYICIYIYMYIHIYVYI